VRVALTIDTEHPDHPCRPGNPAQIAGALRTASVRATFFLQGRWASANPALARTLAEHGHVIGNHANAHARIPELTEDGIRASVSDARAAIEDASGVDPRPWFRCPYGAGQDDPRIQALLDELGYRVVDWDVDANDWEPGLAAAELRRRVREGVRRHGDGARVLMHAWPDVTADTLPEIVDDLRADGADLVGIDEL
jgi:peptidoglycan/xylan/chitin deacetylase (PgdA/CDA1 family)